MDSGEQARVDTMRRMSTMSQAARLLSATAAVTTTVNGSEVIAPVAPARSKAPKDASHSKAVSITSISTMARSLVDVCSGGREVHHADQLPQLQPGRPGVCYHQKEDVRKILSAIDPKPPLLSMHHAGIHAV